MHGQCSNRRGDRWTRQTQPMRRPPADGAARAVAVSQGTPAAGRSWKRQGRGPAGEPTRRRRFQKGTHISVVPSHPVCGSWCQPRGARARRGPRLCGELEAGLSGFLGHTTAGTHGLHSYRAQSRCQRLARVPEVHQRSKQGDITAPGKLTAGDEGTDAAKFVRSAQELGSAPIQRQCEPSVHAGTSTSTWPPFVYWK